MQYLLSKQFEKDFVKLPKPIKKKVLTAIKTFVADPTNPSLRNHALTGRWVNHYSINVTGDMRAIYVYVEKEVVYFVAVGSHSELYG